MLESLPMTFASLPAGYSLLPDAKNIGWGLAAFSAAALAAQYGSIALAAKTCRRQPQPARASSTPPVSIVRPVCGLEPYSRETLGSSFSLDWPQYEVIFCAADPADPVLEIVRDLMMQHPQEAATIRTGRDMRYANPKLANMALGWQAAQHDLIVFTDSNVLMPPDYLHALRQAWSEETGMVSAPPAGHAPQGFWSQVECAMLNEWRARVQYAVNAMGFGFAQGKNLMFHRATLEQGGFETLASEPAEDAAATKLVRGKNLRVSLAAPPFAQMLGPRTLAQVWARHLRWARLRRKTFPWLYAPEIFSGPAMALISVTASAILLEAPAILIAPAFLCLWYAPEIALARLANWPQTLAQPLIYLARDTMIMAIFAASWFGRNIVWNGHVVAGRGEARAQNKARARGPVYTYLRSRLARKV